MDQAPQAPAAPTWEQIVKHAIGAPLSEAERNLLPEVRARLEKRDPLVWEEDAYLVIGGRMEGGVVRGGMAVGLTVRGYGKQVPSFRGDRETPDEPGGLELDDVTICGGGRLAEEVSIYFACSDVDVQNLTERAEENPL